MQQFVHLRTHSRFSVGASTLTIKQIPKLCAAAGMTACALTDTNLMSGCAEFSDVMPSNIVFSSENLKSLGIYNTDLATGTTFDTSAPLAYYKNLAANACICIKLNVPKEEFPSLILVAEEASGALGQYLICYDETGYYGGAYLIPVY